MNEDDLTEQMRDDHLLNEAERVPVVTGISYLLLVIAGLAGVVIWLVMRTAS